MDTYSTRMRGTSIFSYEYVVFCNPEACEAVGISVMALRFLPPEELHMPPSRLLQIPQKQEVPASASVSVSGTSVKQGFPRQGAQEVVSRPNERSQALNVLTFLGSCDAPRPREKSAIRGERKTMKGEQSPGTVGYTKLDRLSQECTGDRTACRCCRR